jgi:hypothetical protein
MDNSPLLESFSLTTHMRRRPLTLDLCQNINLKRVKYSVFSGKIWTSRIYQTNKDKHDNKSLAANVGEFFFKDLQQFRCCLVTLHLPITLCSVSIQDNEYAMYNRNVSSSSSLTNSFSFIIKKNYIKVS